MVAQTWSIIATHTHTHPHTHTHTHHIHTQLFVSKKGNKQGKGKGILRVYE